jgi:hypothetical protein
MRFRFFTVLTALALAVAVVAAFGTGAGARPSAKPAAAAKSKASARPAHVAGTIYGQRDNDNGIGIVSQNFEASFDAYDSQGADDLKIKNKGVVKEVDVDGVYFNGAGPANSVHVTFYKNSASGPGAVVKDVPSATYTDVTGTGTFKIKVPKTVLKKGHYWVSVYVNMDFGTGGEWGWNTNNTVRLRPSMWQNPGNGFSTGCTTWGVTTTCIPAGEGGDFSFALIGKGH